MPEVVHAFVFSLPSLEKLGRRGISAGEVQQMKWDYYRIRPNPRERSMPRHPHRRRLFTGRTYGGRKLTLVIEATLDSTTWLVITGWES